MLIFLFLLVCLLSMERAIEVLHCINKKGQTCTHPKKKKIQFLCAVSQVKVKTNHTK